MVDLGDLATIEARRGERKKMNVHRRIFNPAKRGKRRIYPASGGRSNKQPGMGSAP